MRSCQKPLLCLIERVSADSKTDPVPGTRAEVPLQTLVKTMVRQTVPLQSMEVHERADIHSGPMLEQLVPEELHPLEDTHTGEVNEEIEPVRRIHTGEVCGELSSKLSLWWDPVPEQGKSVRRKEWQRKKSYEQTTTPISYPSYADQVEKIEKSDSS